MKTDVLGARLGAGVSFPVLLSPPHPHNSPGTARTEIITKLIDGGDLVRQSLFLILQTEPGERVMRPDFGCPLAQFLMEPNTQRTRSDIQTTVEDALARWERRAAIESVEVLAGSDPAVVTITVSYRHRRDNSAATLVLPFVLGNETPEFP
jgi:uncharacterized protein